MLQIHTTQAVEERGSSTKMKNLTSRVSAAGAVNMHVGVLTFRSEAFFRLIGLSQPKNLKPDDKAILEQKVAK